MTEDEAKTKWCHRIVLSRTTAAVTDTDRCSASACMAWRWDGTHVDDPDNPKGDLVWSNRSYGHCGLAGDVEPERASSLEYRERAGAPQ